MLIMTSTGWGAVSTIFLRLWYDSDSNPRPPNPDPGVLLLSQIYWVRTPKSVVKWPSARSVKKDSNDLANKLDWTERTNLSLHKIYISYLYSIDEPYLTI